MITIATYAKLTAFATTSVSAGFACYCREQERIAKAESARRETERILREQQAEVDAKKAEMVKRDIQREKVWLTYPLHFTASSTCSVKRCPVLL